MDGDQAFLPEEILLQSARLGNFTMVRELLTARSNGTLKFDINCKGKEKRNNGWTPLHLACYFGHLQVMSALLQHGADVNVVNDAGDTPLHKAAYTGREELVLELVAHKADVFIRNIDGQRPKEVAKGDRVRKLLQAAEDGDIKKKEEELFRAAREGDIRVLENLLKGSQPVNINSTDSKGNTALHSAAHRGQKEAAILLLQSGINTLSKNNRGQMAADLALDQQTKQLLSSVKSVQQLKKSASRFEGPLLRKSKLLGWRMTWAVLERGVLSFFRCRADATTGSRRKGYKYLDGAQIEVDQQDEGVINLHFSDGTQQRFAVPLVNSQEVDRQKWVNALAEHIEYSSYYLKQGLCLEESDEEDEFLPLGTIKDVIQTCQAQQQLLAKQVGGLHQAWDRCVEVGSPWHDMVTQCSLVSESSRQLASSLTHAVTLLSQQEEIRNLQLTQEQERCRVLQESLHVLAQENQELERSVSLQHFEAQDEFFDAFEGDGSVTPGAAGCEDSRSTHTESELFASFPPSMAGSSTSSTPTEVVEVYSKWGRSRLPVTMFSRNDFSVWSILKQCVGKELSKITMPVVFNEPLTFLQRMAEIMEYSNLLDAAASSNDPLERIQLVTAFVVASTSSNWDRLSKPFNPILGETYEMTREEDPKFRLICEQVSHHPPISAFHAEASGYSLDGSIYPKLRFWGKSIEAKPEGIWTLKLLNHQEVYTWKNVTVCVHNIIVGKLWLEQYGTLELMCHSNGLNVALNFKPSGWFSKELHKVEGFVYDRKKKKKKYLYGKWTTYLKSVDVEQYEAFLEANKGTFHPPDLPSSDQPTSNGDSSPQEDCEYMTLENVDMEASRLLWRVSPRPPYSHQYYNFTLFAIGLNELKDDMPSYLPRCDSRLRPDCRKLEEGDIVGAAEEKNRLEEKQREVRKLRKKNHEEWEPLWFRQGMNPHLGESEWVFTDRYWDRNFSSVPDIF